MHIRRFDPPRWISLVKGKASQAAAERPSSPVEEGAPISSFADVARIITGDDNPPLWLVKHFKMWAPSLAMADPRILIAGFRQKRRFA
jgi:hypothetical protein